MNTEFRSVNSAPLFCHLAGIGHLAVPLGLWIGRQLIRSANRHPNGLLAATASGCVHLWVVGAFVG